MVGSWRVQEGLVGFGGSRRVLRSEKVWEGPGESGRVREGPEVSGRV